MRGDETWSVTGNKMWIVCLKCRQISTNIPSSVPEKNLKALNAKRLIFSQLLLFIFPQRKTAAKKNYVINYIFFPTHHTRRSYSYVYVFPSSSGGHKQISGRTYMSQHSKWSEKIILKKKWYTKERRERIIIFFQLFSCFFNGKSC